MPSHQIKIFYKTKKPTDQALILNSALEKYGVKTKLELFDGFKHIDIAIPKAKLDIEIDGVWHLTNPKQIINDLNRGYYSHRRGYSTIHIPNDLIETHLDQIAKALSKVCALRSEKINLHFVNKSQFYKNTKSLADKNEPDNKHRQLHQSLSKRNSRAVKTN